MLATIGNIVLVVGAIYLLWRVVQFAMQLSQFKPLDAIVAVAMLFIAIIAFTNRGSPINVVRTADVAYGNVKDELAQTQVLSDLVSAFGQQPEAFGLSGPGASADTTTQSGGDTTTTTTTVVVPPAQTTVMVPNSAAFPYRMSIPANDQVTIRSLDGATTTIADLVATHELCIASWVDAMWARGCGQLEGWDVTVESWMAVPPAQVAQTSAPSVTTTTTTGPDPNSPEVKAAKAQCWTTWATYNLTGTTAAWGPEALPLGTKWELTGPGEVGSWATASNEQWTLTSREFGITDFPVNGHVARVFQNADDSGTVIVYGTNPNIWQECVALVQ